MAFYEATKRRQAMVPTGTGAVRVNVNPSSHEQLKIILTSEEGDGGRFH